MIAFLAAAADAMPETEFCFDCPGDDYSILGELAVSLGVALIAAVPGFFIGMLVHRLLAQTPMLVRLMIVGGLTVAFWFSLRPFLDDIVFVSAFLAVLASLFDGLRVNAERSSERFTED